jgi:hypothetical protein
MNMNKIYAMAHFGGAIALAVACGCSVVPLTVRHSREAGYTPYTSVAPTAKSEAARLYFLRHRRDTPLVLTVWTDKQGPLALTDETFKSFGLTRFTIGKGQDVNADATGIPRLAIGYGNDFYGNIRVQSESIFIPFGSMCAAKVLDALLMSYREVQVQGDLLDLADAKPDPSVDTYVVSVEDLSFYEGPLNHINMDMSLYLGRFPQGGDKWDEARVNRSIRAVSLGSVLNTSVTLIKNLDRIVDAEL